MFSCHFRFLSATTFSVWREMAASVWSIGPVWSYPTKVLTWPSRKSSKISDSRYAARCWLQRTYLLFVCKNSKRSYDPDGRLNLISTFSEWSWLRHRDSLHCLAGFQVDSIVVLLFCVHLIPLRVRIDSAEGAIDSNCPSGSKLSHIFQNFDYDEDRGATVHTLDGFTFTYLHVAWL